MVLVTAHPGIDYAAVLEQSAVLVDLRGVTRKIANAAAAQDSADPVLASAG